MFRSSSFVRSLGFFSLSIILTLFVITSANPAVACMPILINTSDSMQLNGTSATVTFGLRNDTTCDAVGYKLAFHSVMPTSAECLQGNYSGSNPTFTINAGAAGFAVAEIPVVPPETAGCSVFFDIITDSGSPMPPLSGGRMYATFGSGGAGGPCVGAVPPTIQNARLSHFGNGQVLVSAGISNKTAPVAPDVTPVVPPATTVLTANLELNGTSIPMDLLDSGDYGATGAGNITKDNDYQITASNGCFVSVFSFINGVASSFFYGEGCQSTNICYPESNRSNSVNRPQFASAKGHPITNGTTLRLGLH